jgi:MYXO-CTERM domain-containing protein
MRFLLTASLLIASTAHAHFVLQAPASWYSQDSLGLPQKLGPCGDEGGGMPTGAITVYQMGQTITVTIDETIMHPGHYRVALAVNDRSELPAEPVVTPGTGTPCGSAAVENAPVFPVLADGVLDHSQAFTAPQSFQVKLPDGVTCEKCTLQVIEFMSQHPLNNPGGCFYHHCADIKIQAGPVDGGATDADTGNGGSSSGCQVGPSPRGPLLLGFFAVALLVLLIRRRA